MKILGTGLSGLVGSRIVELLPQYEFSNVSRQNGFDITSKEDVLKYISSSDSSIVLHSAAKTNVDECEKDKNLGKEGEAWRINVLGTEYVAQACKEFNKKLIYISTDFVFDGIAPPEDGYSEEDVPKPLNWYGETKYQGEKRISETLADFAILRITYPYRAFFNKPDFVRAIFNKLKTGEKIKAVEDQIITPTFIDDIALALDAIIKNANTGLFHVVGSSWLSPYEAALAIADLSNISRNFVQPISADEFFKDRAPRPLHLKTKNAKIVQLGIAMRSFEEGLQKIKLTI